VTIEGENDPVEAVNDYFTFSTSPLVVAAPGGFANDIDPDGDPLSANTPPPSGVVTPPAEGNLGPNGPVGQGGFTYTPDGSFDGADVFEYGVTDGTSSDTAFAFISQSTQVYQPDGADPRPNTVTFDHWVTPTESTLEVTVSITGDDPADVDGGVADDEYLQVFIDNNNNGAFDGGDTNIGNIELTLVGSTLTGTFSGVDVSAYAGDTADALTIGVLIGDGINPAFVSDLTVEFTFT
jgi:hypothetical protein